MKDFPTILSRNIRLAVPALSVVMLLVLALLVASGKGTSDVFVPIYVLMLVVYVLSSVYFFKTFMERERETVPPT